MFAADTQPRTIWRSLDRATLFALAGVLLALNGFADTILGTFRQVGMVDGLLALAGVSAIAWFALFAALSIAREPGFDPCRAYDLPVLALAGFAALVPSSWIAALGLCALGLSYLAASGDRETRSGRIALVLIALSGPLLWGRLIMVALSPTLLTIDSQFVALLAGTEATGNTVRFAGDAGQFVVGIPCSSIHNISLAVVLWGTLVSLLKLRIDLRLTVFCIAAAVAMFLVNAVRLASIALLPDQIRHAAYRRWGDGLWVGQYDRRCSDCRLRGA